MLHSCVGELPKSMPPLRKKTILAAVFGLLWLAAVGCGLGMLVNYETTPGPVVVAPMKWPADSGITPAADRATLVMLAHPHCPCTRASIGELAQIMADAEGKLTAYVLFLKPADSGADWDDTPLRKSAAAIPGVAVLSDADGAEARRFGAETSGQTLLFAADGRLLFSGGITQARGHAGRNAGETAILALLRHEHVDRPTTQVFGCSFVTPSNS